MTRIENCYRNERYNSLSDQLYLFIVRGASSSSSKSIGVFEDTTSENVKSIVDEIVELRHVDHRTISQSIY
jgi:hypothetical protein